MVENFIPEISNWSVCDAFCADLKIVKKHQEIFLPLVLKNLKSKREFNQRTAFNLSRAYYIDSPYFKKVLAAVLKIKPKHYYSQMAQAWFMCEAYIKHPKETEKYLKNLISEVYKMTIRKLKDSYRVKEY